MRASADVLVWPRHYAHVDLNVAACDALHESTQLLLESSLTAVLDRNALDVADSMEFEDAPSRFTRWFSNRPAARQAEMAALRERAAAPAIFPALVAPWMDVGCVHAGVSTIIHNNGSEPLVVR